MNNLWLANATSLSLTDYLPLFPLSLLSVCVCVQSAAAFVAYFLGHLVGGD